MNKISKNIKPEIIINAVILILAIAVGAFLEWKFIDIITLLIFVSYVLFSFSSRYLALAAIVLLGAVPVLTLLKKEDWTEKAAVYAFYFLIFTVAAVIIESRKDDGIGKEEIIKT